MSKTVHISSATEFSGLLRSTRVVVADFYADWCGPCKAIAPFFDTLATKHSRPNAVVFTKINTDNNRDITSTHSISAMPTFLIFKGGREVTRIQGADPKKLEQAVTSAIADVSSFEGSGRKLGDVVPAAAATAATAAAAVPTAGRAAAGGKPAYLWNGQAVASKPFAARFQEFMDAAYVFLGLYLITFFSFNPYAAAEESSFNQKNRVAGKRPGWGGFSGFGRGGGGGGPGGSGGPGGRKVGTVNDVRGAECKSGG